jgi:hypothetical protein
MITPRGNLLGRHSGGDRIHAGFRRIQQLPRPTTVGCFMVDTETGELRLWKEYHDQEGWERLIANAHVRSDAEGEKEDGADAVSAKPGPEPEAIQQAPRRRGRRP